MLNERMVWSDDENYDDERPSLSVKSEIERESSDKHKKKKI